MWSKLFTTALILQRQIKVSPQGEVEFGIVNKRRIYWEHFTKESQHRSCKLVRLDDCKYPPD